MSSRAVNEPDIIFIITIFSVREQFVDFFLAFDYSLINDEIKNIEDPNIRDVFKLTLTGTLSQASNLVFVIRGRKRNEGAAPKAEVGSWVIGYWVPEEHFEINVWNCFENRFKRIINTVVG